MDNIQKMDTKQFHLVKNSWKHIYISLITTSILAGLAILFNILNDDIVMQVGLMVSAVLSTFQLFTHTTKKSLFLKCFMFSVIPMGFMVIGQGFHVFIRYSIKARRLPIGYLSDGLFGAVMFGVFISAIIVVLYLLKDKFIIKKKGLTLPFLSDDAFRRKTTKLLVIMPTAFAVYLINRFLSKYNFSASMRWGEPNDTINNIIAFIKFTDFLFVIGALIILAYFVRLSWRTRKKLRNVN